MHKYFLLIVISLLLVSCTPNKEDKPSENPNNKAGIILEMDQNGEVQFESQKFGSPSSFLKDDKGNIIVSDKGKRLFTEVSPKGDTHWIYTQGDFESIKKTKDGNYLLVNENVSPNLLEITPNGDIVFQLDNANYIGEAHKLDNGNYLLVSREDQTAKIIDKNKKEIWKSSEKLFKQPYSIQPLANNQYLVSDFDNHRIVEIDSKSKIIWEYKQNLNHPVAAIKTSNGNYIISDRDNKRVVVINKDGTIVKEMGKLVIRSLNLSPNGTVTAAGEKEI